MRRVVFFVCCRYFIELGDECREPALIGIEQTPLVLDRRAAQAASRSGPERRGGRFTRRGDRLRRAVVRGRRRAYVVEGYRDPEAVIIRGEADQADGFLQLFLVAIGRSRGGQSGGRNSRNPALAEELQLLLQQRFFSPSQFFGDTRLFLETTFLLALLVFGETCLLREPVLLREARFLGETALIGDTKLRGEAHLLCQSCLFQQSRFLGESRFFAKALLFRHACLLGQSCGFFGASRSFFRAPAFLSEPQFFGVATCFCEPRCLGHPRLFCAP